MANNGQFQMLHTMVRVRDLDKSIDFYTRLLGMTLLRKREVPEAKYTNVFVGYGPEDTHAVLELTYNWDPENYDKGRNFGHLAFSVKNIYETCQKLMDAGVTINRPPREGRMAFVKSPDNISIELLQQGENLEISEPWSSMENIGSW